MVVLAWLHPVQVEDVHMIRTQSPERTLKALGQFGCGDQGPAEHLAKPGLGGEEHLVTAPSDPFAHRRLGAIDTCGVDEADAEVEGAADDVRGLMDVRAAGHSQAAVPAAAQAHDTDMSACSAQTNGLHRAVSSRRIERSTPTAYR
jgi:hypothetical protein